VYILCELFIRHVFGINKMGFILCFESGMYRMLLYLKDRFS